MRILAIDDEPCLLRLYPRALRDHEVLALSPEEALVRIGSDADFDLVICDLNLKKVEGQWFHERLVSVARTLKERIIFCTGGAQDAEGHKILELARGRVLYKPFDSAQLRAAVARLAGEGRRAV